MFGEGYFSISFEILVVSAIALFSAWLVVRQLNETRLASQMEGIITLSLRWSEVESISGPLDKFIKTKKWQNMEPEEAVTYIQSKDDLWQLHNAIQGLFELLGGLMKSGALDENVAYEQFGFLVPASWNQLEKYSIGVRLRTGADSLSVNWEWLAKRFEKMSS